MPAFSHLSPLGEDDVLRRRAAGDSPTEMAEVLDRDLSSVVHHVQRLESPERAQPKPVGLPAALIAKHVDLFVLRQQYARATFRLVALVLRLVCSPHV